MMDGETWRQAGMDRVRGSGGQYWTSQQCFQNVEEMLTKALVHQEDLLSLLTVHSSEAASSPDEHTVKTTSTMHSISTPVFRAMKVKLENSMDWCHLALCRLKEIVLHSNPPQPQPKSGDDHKFLNSPHRLNASHPLSPHRVLHQRKGDPALYSYTGNSNSSAGRSNGPWSTRNVCFSETSQLPDAAGTGEEDEEEPPIKHMAIRGSGRENQQGYNFVRVQTLGMDSDMLAESPPPPPLLTEPHQHSSSSQIHIDSYNDGNVGEIKDYGDTEAGNYITKASSRGLRSKAGGKCDAKNSTGEEATPAVVFQKLKPGTENKKGIPDDGHRGWKKYGNKAIQNSNFCRGYYKCSVKDCRAKKMVQPTDEDPSIFEVTYVGRHTCSGTVSRRDRSRARAPPPVEVEIQEAEMPFGRGTSDEDNVQTKSTVTKDSGTSGGEWKKRAGAQVEEEDEEDEGEEEEEDSRLTGSNVEPDRPPPSKRGRVDRGNDISTVLDTRTTSTTTNASEEENGGGEVAAIDRDSNHHQSEYSLIQDPLLWQDFIDNNLSPSGHKSVSDSVSP